MGNANGLAAKLGRLEVVARGRCPAPGPPSEDDRRRHAAWARLLASMDPGQARILDGWPDREEIGGEPGRAAERLGRAAWVIVREHLERGRPLALPPAVAEAYLRDVRALGLHDCEGCGYTVPVHCGTQGAQDGQVVTLDPTRGLFPCCPLCDGRTGYYAYFQKHGPEART